MSGFSGEEKPDLPTLNRLDIIHPIANHFDDYTPKSIINAVNIYRIRLR